MVNSAIRRGNIEVIPTKIFMLYLGLPNKYYVEFRFLLGISPIKLCNVYVLCNKFKFLLCIDWVEYV